MKSSTFRLLGTTSLVAILGLTWVPGSLAADYFTEVEIEQIREAQSIERRIPVFLEIANIRLVRLGLVEGEEEVDNEEGGGNSITRGIIRILSPEAADELERIDDELSALTNDLSMFSRGDLLRGYYQALEEAMDNIDDAYERDRGDVRKPLENLLEFVENTIPALGEFSPDDGNEEIALEDAIEIAELARDGATEALDIVPQTEER